MKKYIIVLGVLIVITGGIWIYVARDKTANVTDIKQVFNDQGFSISEGSKSLSGEYIPDTSNLDLGIKVYPGAKIISDKGAAENLNFSGTKVTAATYTTSDSRDKVEKYYQNQIGSDAIVAEAVDGSMKYRVIKSKTDIGSFVNVWVEDDTTYFTIIKPVS